MRALRLAAALLAGALAGAPAAALAQSPLERAVEAYRAGELDRAPALFEAALATPGNGPEELALIYRSLGVLRAATGDAAGAREAFARSLAIDPGQATPGELGGAQRAVFEGVRDARGGRALTVEVRAPALASASDAVVTVATLGAPEGLVHALRVTARGGGGPEWSVTAEGAGPARVPLPSTAIVAGAPTRVAAEALDEHGGVLARGEATVVVAAPAPLVEEQGGAGEEPAGTGEEPASPAEAAPPEGAPPEAGPPRRDLTWLWITLGVVGGLLVAGGVTVGVIAGTSTTSYELGAPRVE